MATEEVLDVLVVGAGPAGLTAAYLLSKEKNLSVSVIESNTTYVGGISRTEEYKGYLFDIGGHRFFSKSKDVEALWREILPDDFLDRPRSSRILYKRKFYSYPLRAFEALTNLGFFQSFFCVCSYAKARAFPNRHPSSFHQWVANQFGERLFGIFFKTYTEKVWGISCDALSADWAAQRIKGLNLATAIFSAIGKSVGRRGSSGGKGGCVVKTLIESFRYPRRGPGMMWEAARQKVLVSGGRVELGVTAIGFHRQADLDLWDVSAVRADGSRCVYRTRRIISSAPLRDVVQAVRPLPDGARLAAKLSYRDFITVAVMLNRRPAFDDNWIYIHDPSVKVGRVQNFSSWSPEMVPDSQSGCLGLEYFCFEGDDLWTTADADLVALAVKELSALGLASPDQVIDGRVVRQPKAYPVYDADYKEIVESIKTEFIAKYPGLYFVGRNGMHKYNNQDHAMMTAMLTVKNIINGNEDYDVWLVNEDAEYHEEIKGA